MRSTYLFQRKILVLFSIFILGLSNISAQEKPNREVVYTRPAKVRHYLGGWLYTGYSAMFHNIPQTDVCGGIGAGIGGGYQLRANKFMFNTGIEFAFINSVTKIDNLTGETVVNAINSNRADGTPINTVMVRYGYRKYNDSQRAGIINVPIMAGMRLGGKYNYYFLAGTKVGLPVFGFNSSKGKVNMEVYDKIETSTPVLIANYDNRTIKGNTNTSNLDNINVMASAEFGLELNQWLDKTEKVKKKAKNRREKGSKMGRRQQFVRETPRMRAALFVDYGLTNINKNENSGGQLSSVPTHFSLANMGKEVTFENHNLLTTNSAFDNGKVKRVNPFIVGVKGSVFFDVTKPKRRSYPPAPVLPPAPRVISGKLIDVETKKEVKEAQLIITDTLNKALYIKNLKGQGTFDTKLRREGHYKVFVMAPNYYKHKQQVYNVGDTLMVYLKPVKKGETFVLKNIYFNTDDTTLTAESNKELDKQALFLKENRNINIIIVGHTDSQGSDVYNMKLSEERALSVKKALIDRGISPERLKSEGRGKTQPIASNETEEGRAENRRIEIEIQ